MKKFDRRFLGVALLAVFMLLLWTALIVNGTHTCPDGHGVFLPQHDDPATVQKVCRETTGTGWVR